MGKFQKQLPIKFFACTPERIEDEVRRIRECNEWVYDWPNVDYDWLFGTPHYSPLAREYYYRAIDEINNAVNKALEQCENSKYAPQPQPKQGLSIKVSSRLDKSNAAGTSDSDTHFRIANVRVPFSSKANYMQGPCPMVPRELFAEPVGFDAVLYGPENGNFRWEWEDPQQVPQDPYFPHYGRTLRFKSYSRNYLGAARITLNKVVGLWVKFNQRLIPPSVINRVDLEQWINYKIMAEKIYLGFIGVVEVTHLESGNVWHEFLGHSPGNFFWLIAESWAHMAPDSNGIIQIRGGYANFYIETVVPQTVNLPKIGTYRMRYILLAYGVSVENCLPYSPILNYNLGMYTKLISFSYMPSLVSYTPGVSTGIIPPLEIIYKCSPVLYPNPGDGTGILFDAVFDLKNGTGFRFIVKVGNTLDFAVGVVIQAGRCQAWVRLEPGETKYLAGNTVITGMTLRDRETNDYHPSVLGGGSVVMRFSLFLTAPDNPETTPNNMPAKKVSLWYDSRPYGDLADPSDLRLGSIKKYAYDGSYDYDYNLLPGEPTDNVPIVSITKSIQSPTYPPLIDPISYFHISPEDLSYYPLYISMQHHTPWPLWPNWTYGLRVNGEVYNSETHTWEYREDIVISLDNYMNQQVADILGITDRLIIDSDDVRWLDTTLNSRLAELLWVNRFYLPNGTLIDEDAMRQAFQIMIDNNASNWPDYRNLVVHPYVRFGIFLYVDTPIGYSMVGIDGNLVEVPGIEYLDLVSTKFLYLIRRW